MISLVTLIVLSSMKVSGYPIPGVYTDVTGTDVQFQALEGKPLLVDATASWCTACDQQLKYLAEVYDVTKNDVNILTLSIDINNDNVQKVIELKNRFNSPWTFGWDQYGDFQSKYTVSSLPTLFLFTSTGDFVTAWTGITPPNVIIDKINSLNPFKQYSLSENQESVDEDRAQATSLIGELFGSSTFQLFIVVLVIFIFYIRSTSKPQNLVEETQDSEKISKGDRK